MRRLVEFAQCILLQGGEDGEGGRNRTAGERHPDPDLTLSETKGKEWGGAETSLDLNFSQVPPTPDSSLRSNEASSACLNASAASPDVWPITRPMSFQSTPADWFRVEMNSYQDSVQLHVPQRVASSHW